MLTLLASLQLKAPVSYSRNMAVAASHYHPEVFSRRHVMFMVGFLPPRSWISPGYHHRLSPHHLLHSPWSPALMAEPPRSSPGTQRCCLIRAQYMGTITVLLQRRKGKGLFLLQVTTLRGWSGVSMCHIPLFRETTEGGKLAFYTLCLGH